MTQGDGVYTLETVREEYEGLLRSLLFQGRNSQASILFISDVKSVLAASFHQIEKKHELELPHQALAMICAQDSINLTPVENMMIEQRLLYNQVVGEARRLAQNPGE